MEDWGESDVFFSKKQSSSVVKDFFDRNITRWARRLPADALDPNRGTWLRWAKNVGAGCWLCNKAGVNTVFGQYGLYTKHALQLSHFLRHQQQNVHLQAAAKIFGTDTEELEGTPSEAQFVAVIKDRKKGVALSQGNADVGGFKKIVKMVYCAAEAKLDLSREHSSKSNVHMLMQDGLARSDRHLIRLAGTTDNLLGDRNVLWQGRVAKATSPNIRNEVFNSILKFCTPRLEPPFVEHGAQESSPELVMHICNTMELLVTDKASNEMRAGRLMRGDANDDAGIFPNMKAHLPDPTHALTRVLFERPIHAEPIVHDVLERFVLGKNSITSIIQNSVDFQNEFQRRASKIEASGVDGRKVRNMNLARHRISSCQVPMGRNVLFFDATWGLGVTILRTRQPNSSEYLNTTAFFEGTNEERCVLLSMIADYGDEVMAPLRMSDSENCDICELPDEIEACLHRLDVLFIQMGCLSTGYTAHMITLLQQERAVVLPSGVKKIGGANAVTPEIVQRCLRCMCHVLKLCIAGLNAEFPSWKLTQSFQVFKLHKDGKATSTTDPHVVVHLHRLAQVWGVNKTNLVKQFGVHYPIALEIFKRTPGIDSWMAWAEAINRVRKRKDHRLIHDLHTIVQRLVAFRGATTSGVEQTFQITRLLTSGNRSNKDEVRENNEMTVRMLDDTEIVPIAKKAMKIWAETYGNVRKSGSNFRLPRLDKNCPRMWTPTKSTKCADAHPPPILGGIRLDVEWPGWVWGGGGPPGAWRRYN